MSAEEALARMTALHQERAEVRSKLVKCREVERLGVVEVFSRDTEGTTRGISEVVYLKTKWGGHDKVGLVEGVQDMMGDIFRLRE